MIIGASGRECVARLKNRSGAEGYSFLGSDEVCLGVRKPSGSSDPDPGFTGMSSEGRFALAFYGDDFRNQAESRDISRICRFFHDIIRGGDVRLLSHLTGGFALAMWDDQDHELILARDPLGILQMYAAPVKGGVFFASRLPAAALLSGQAASPSMKAMVSFLTFCYNPGRETFFPGIFRLRPGHAWVWKPGKQEEKRYWPLSFSEISGDSETVQIQKIRENLSESVRRRISPAAPGVFLSGGLDSSTVTALLSRHGVRDIQTFSFRCEGETFDESHYAKFVAEHFKTRHCLVEYKPESVLLAESMVQLMDEPFCDVGINIATVLLASEARGRVVDLFTGDGGDELFAGHPVYQADKAAALTDRMPGSVLRILSGLGKQLPDSEKKKDWKVKMKRFTESYWYPKELQTQRWRAYYLPNEIGDSLVSGEGGAAFQQDIFQEMIGWYREAGDVDPLARTLYGDYLSVVQFYLRRMEMARSFGLVPRFPMLDTGLVTLLASIPSRMKKPGWQDSKCLEKKVVENWLPNQIVHRKDKLGHSIPLKNWIRNDPGVRSFIFDHLSEDRMRKRGLMKPEFVRKMIEEHVNYRRNHSHRLWALTIFELWMDRVYGNIQNSIHRQALPGEPLLRN